jgi:hypothetical protein
MQAQDLAEPLRDQRKKVYLLDPQLDSQCQIFLCFVDIVSMQNTIKKCPDTALDEPCDEVYRLLILTPTPEQFMRSRGCTVKGDDYREFATSRAIVGGHDIEKLRRAKSAVRGQHQVQIARVEDSPRQTVEIRYDERLSALHVEDPVFPAAFIFHDLRPLVH